MVEGFTSVSAISLEVCALECDENELIVEAPEVRKSVKAESLREEILCPIDYLAQERAGNGVDGIKDGHAK